MPKLQQRKVLRRPGQRWPVMDPGWINERVNMSDWEVRGDSDNEIAVSEILGGSTSRTLGSIAIKTATRSLLSTF